jgi:TPR repeat protein
MSGYMYVVSFDLEKNVQQTIQHFTESAKSGNTKATLMLAFFNLDKYHKIRSMPGTLKSRDQIEYFLSQLKLTPDTEIKKNRLLEAFNKKDPEAIAICAYLSLQENCDPAIVERKDQIMKALTSAAATDAQCAYLIAHFSEKDLLSNISSSDVEEQSAMGKLFSFFQSLEKKIFGEKDFFEAIDNVIQCYERAALLGSVHARHRLINLRLGDRQLPESLREKYTDMTAGIEQMKLAAMLEGNQVALELARLYAEGKCTASGSRELVAAQSTSMAIQWYECAATKSVNLYRVRDAINELIEFLAFDHVNVRDKIYLEHLLKWGNEGIKLGLLQSSFDLGVFHLFGLPHLGLDRNEERAEYYFRQVGFAAGRIASEIEEFYKKNKNHPQIALQHYIKWMLRSIAIGDPNANNVARLAFLFRYGNTAFDGLISESLSLATKLEKMCDDIRHKPIEEQTKISDEELISLARECYQAAGVPVIEDEFLTNIDALTLVEEESEEKEVQAASLTLSARK